MRLKIKCKECNSHATKNSLCRMCYTKSQNEKLHITNNDDFCIIDNCYDVPNLNGYCDMHSGYFVKNNDDCLICAFDSCSKKAKVKSLCKQHYHSKWKSKIKDKCIIDGCDNYRHAKNLCSIHYLRYYRAQRNN